MVESVGVEPLSFVVEQAVSAVAKATSNNNFFIFIL
jgi:hypothetical protein